MKDCTLVTSLLDDFIDRELDDAPRSEVGNHLESCAACLAELKELQALRAAAQDLPSEVRPPRDLWPGIASEIATPSKTSTFLRQALAAAFLVAILAGALWYGRQPAGPGAIAQGPESADDGIVAAANASPSFTDARISYLEARTELIEIIEVRRSALPPETLEVIDTNLALIDEAIFEIEEALAATPQRDRLENHLLTAYNQQIGLLKRAARLSTSA